MYGKLVVSDETEEKLKVLNSAATTGPSFMPLWERNDTFFYYGLKPSERTVLLFLIKKYHPQSPVFVPIESLFSYKVAVQETGLSNAVIWKAINKFTNSKCECKINGCSFSVPALLDIVFVSTGFYAIGFNGISTMLSHLNSHSNPKQEAYNFGVK
jgi:hypothetical protein